ncbi:MAG: hypothetical protein IPO20_22700 [Gammaproteobacteria bacterium]|nr:hypothetical protein [Gammaproteobacteria bacterium]
MIMKVAVPALEAFPRFGQAALADRGELVAAQYLLDARDLGRGRHAHADPVRLARQLDGGNDLHWDTRDLLGAAQLLALHHLERRGARGVDCSVTVVPPRLYKEQA